jgi:sec-independent protein translocase protein TatB
VAGIGLGEFLGIAIVALIVLGPEKLPRYAADAARMLRQLRRMAQDARAEVTRELGPELGDLGLADLNPRSLVRKHLLDPIDLDDLDDGRPKRGASHGSGSPGASADSRSPGEPPPYDEDAT